MGHMAVTTVSKPRCGDTDEKVASQVREWEIAQGREPQDWVAIGREERRAKAEELLEKWKPEG